MRLHQENMEYEQPAAVVATTHAAVGELYMHAKEKRKILYHGSKDRRHCCHMFSISHLQVSKIGCLTQNS